MEEKISRGISTLGIKVDASADPLEKSRLDRT
jgi:hypothetical protein